MLGHIGLTLFCGYLFQRFTNNDYSSYFIFLGFGSMLPDIIDKPIGSIFFNTGRWFGHSILVLTTLLFISWYFGKGKKYNELHISSIAKIVYIGSLFHLVEDVGISKIVVFWPLFGGFTSGEKGDFLQGFEDPFTIFFEAIGLISIIIIGISEKWGRRSWYMLLLMILTYLFVFLISYLLIIRF